MVDEPHREDGRSLAGSRAAAPAVAEILNKIVSTPLISIGYEIMNSDKTYRDDNSTISKKHYPDFDGMTRREAIKTCKINKFGYEFVGDGEIVTHQTPNPGAEVLDNTPLLLYTDELIIDDEKIIVMPNCVGRSMKDAINALSIKGIKPTFQGVGKIVGQKPTAGTVITGTDPCTLYCKTRIEE
jgi:hypothetical protein